MKFYAILAAALLLSAPITVYAEDAPEQAEEPAEISAASGEYEYTIDTEGNVTLDHFLPGESYAGEVTIPSEIEGHPVTCLGKGLFMSATGITAVTIPASVTDVGVHVFFDCESLETFHVEEGNPYLFVENDVLYADEGRLLVAYPAAKADETYTVPDGVEEFTSGAFGFTQHLKELNIADGVQYLGRWTFGHSDTLEKVDIPGSVVMIEDYAFAYCTALNSVTFHSGTDEISHAAFAYDTALKQVTLPDTLKTVGQYAFCGTGLSCITIPPYVESISYCAFGYDSDMKPIHDFVVYGQPGTEAAMYATASDPDNDYENKFTFVAVEDATIPYELGGGRLYSEATEPEETEAPASAEDSSTVITETDEDGNPVKIEDKIGAGLFGNKRLQLILGIGGGTAILLAIVLIIAFAKKPKKAKDNADAKESPEETSEETSSEAEAAPAEDPEESQQDAEKDDEA